MRRRTVIVAAALTAFGGSLRSAGVMTDWKGPPAAPPIDLYTPSGEPFALSSLLGKVVLVNFWATWCEPCTTEMPSLQRVRDQFAPGFEVLGVNYQEGPARIKAFIDKGSITFPDRSGHRRRSREVVGCANFPGQLPDRSSRPRQVRADRRRRLDKFEAHQHNSGVAVGVPLSALPRDASLARAAASFSENNMMKRRTLLRALPAAGLLSTVPRFACAQSAQSGWRTFETVTRLEIDSPAGTVQAWVPLPLSQDTDWFQALENSVSGNFERSRVVIEPVYRAAMVVATFKAGEQRPVIEVTSHFRTRDRKVELKPGAGMQATPAELATYLKPTEFMPTDGIVRETALDITKHARTDVDKARAVYEWVIDNTERNPKTRGCGIGDIKAMLESGTLNGK